MDLAFTSDLCGAQTASSLNSIWVAFSAFQSRYPNTFTPYENIGHSFGSRRRDQVSMFHASPQREGELDMAKDSGDVIALQLLDTSRRFKGERIGKNSPSF